MSVPGTAQSFTDGEPFAHTRGIPRRRRNETAAEARNSINQSLLTSILIATAYRRDERSVRATDRSGSPSLPRSLELRSTRIRINLRLALYFYFAHTDRSSRIAKLLLLSIGNERQFIGRDAYVSISALFRDIARSPLRLTDLAGCTNRPHV